MMPHETVVFLLPIDRYDARGLSLSLARCRTEGRNSPSIYFPPCTGEWTQVSSMKGLLFGEDCERRIFYPTSQNVHLEAYMSRQRSSDPLASLGLMPSSPYKELKSIASVRTMIERDKSESLSKCRDQQGSTDQRMQTTGAQVPSERCTGTSLSSGRFPSPPKYNISKQQLKGADLCSPVRLEECGSAARNRTRMRNVDELIGCDGKDQSITTLLERMRGVERATIAEATRLRREADPSALIRRFLRRSG